MSLKHRHLQIFDALMRAGSVSGAAERLNVTQPAVSVALMDLEKRLGFRLFERARGNFHPTREAQMFHDEAAHGLAAMTRIERLAADIRNGQVGSISIASNGAAAINLLPRVIAEFHQQWPGIRVDLDIRSSRQCAAAVSSRRADIGLIDAPVPVAGLEARIFNLSCVCIMRQDDPLAAHEAIHPTHLIGKSVVSIMGDHRIDTQLDALMAQLDSSVDRRASGCYFAIVRNMVRRGVGVALVDSVNGKMDLGDGVIWRRFEPQLDYELAMIVPKDQSQQQNTPDLTERIAKALIEQASA